MSEPTERTVLFLCVENACRSLMAESMFNAQAPTGWRAVSAGTDPAIRANPRTAPILRTIGLEPPSHSAVTVTNALIDESSIRVNMGCLDSDRCPAHLREVHLRDWELPDPARLDDAGFRGVRYRWRQQVAEIVRELSERPDVPSGARPS